jgi:hypothetical protein
MERAKPKTSARQEKPPYTLAYIAFKRSDTESPGCTATAWRYYYNRSISKFIGPYVHCELAFKRTPQDRYYKCFVILIGKAAFWRKRESFVSLDWKAFRINIRKDRVEAIYRKCKQDVKNGLSYDASVYCNLFVPTHLQCVHPNKGWCSQHAVKSLQDAGTVPSVQGLDQYSISPNQLFEIVSNDAASFTPVDNMCAIAV